MRISDWSSDVCSSDLYVYGITSALLAGGTALALVTQSPVGAQVAQNEESEIAKAVPRAGAPESFADLVEQLQPAVVNISTKQEVTLGVRLNPFAGKIGRASCRERVCQYV